MSAASKLTDKIFCITIPMAPVGKGRPLVTRHGTFTPTKTRNAEATIKLFVARAVAGRKRPLFDGPITMRLAFTAERPKTNKRVYPTTKPDLDNTIKLVCDALNDLVYRDDSQVCYLWATKEYGQVGSIGVIVQELRPESENREKRRSVGEDLFSGLSPHPSTKSQIDENASGAIWGGKMAEGEKQAAKT